MVWDQRPRQLLQQSKERLLRPPETVREAHGGLSPSSRSRPDCSTLSHSMVRGFCSYMNPGFHWTGQMADSGVVVNSVLIFTAVDTVGHIAGKTARSTAGFRCLHAPNTWFKSVVRCQALAELDRDLFRPGRSRATSNTCRTALKDRRCPPLAIISGKFVSILGANTGVSPRWSLRRLIRRNSELRCSTYRTKPLWVTSWLTCGEEHFSFFKRLNPNALTPVIPTTPHCVVVTTWTTLKSYPSLNVANSSKYRSRKVHHKKGRYGREITPGNSHPVHTGL